MAKYIHFTEEQKQQAASVDLEHFLQSRGEKLISSGREKRLASDHSITVRGNEWYDHAEARGGHAVSFVQKFYRMSYPEAVSLLLGGIGSNAYPLAEVKEQMVAKFFDLPPAHSDMRRVYAYLTKHRGIDRNIITAFARAKLIYEDAEYHNAVFVGTDAAGTARHAHKRSTNSSGKAFRINVEGSDPKYSFHHIGTDGRLYVFEAPIDLLSYISLNPDNWQEHSYVACCGTSSHPVMELVTQHPEIKAVYLCLDNDTAGQTACKRMAALLEMVGVPSMQLIPFGKDWNDDLLAKRQIKEVSTQCQGPGF